MVMGTTGSQIASYDNYAQFNNIVRENDDHVVLTRGVGFQITHQKSFGKSAVGSIAVVVSNVSRLKKGMEQRTCIEDNKKVIKDYIEEQGIGNKLGENGEECLNKWFLNDKATYTKSAMNLIRHNVRNRAYGDKSCALWERCQKSNAKVITNIKSQAQKLSDICPNTTPQETCGWLEGLGNKFFDVNHKTAYYLTITPMWVSKIKGLMEKELRKEKGKRKLFPFLDNATMEQVAREWVEGKRTRGGRGNKQKANAGTKSTTKPIPQAANNNNNSNGKDKKGFGSVGNE